MNNRSNYRGNSRGGYQHNNQSNYSQQQSNQQTQSNNANELNNNNKSETTYSLFTASTAYSSNVSNEWLLDSGASHHMTGNCDFFKTFNKLENPVIIHFGDHSTIYACG